jgi:septum formation protein
VSDPDSVRFVLASGSPTRLRVLRDAGFDPDVVVSGVSEEIEGLETARAVVVLAERKARAVADVDAGPPGFILGCDSLLDLDGTALGKPASPADAKAMWRRLSGHTGVLHTGHCLVDARSGRWSSHVDSTPVRFGRPSPEEIDAYVASGEPLSLAGAFSIDGLAAPFIDGIDGVPSNVLGVSLPLLRRMFEEAGIAFTDLWRQRPG